MKVFKDKGADRKQRQEQLKIEKLTPQDQVCVQCMVSSNAVSFMFILFTLCANLLGEQAIYHRSRNVTLLCQGLPPLLFPESPLQHAVATPTQRIERYTKLVCVFHTATVHLQ